MKRTLILHAQNGWYLKSEIKTNANVMLRSYNDEGEVMENRYAREAYEKWEKGSVLEYEMARVQMILPAGYPKLTSLNKDKGALWLQVFDYLKANWSQPVAPLFEGEKTGDVPTRIIPVIRLRHLYRFLRALPASELPKLLGRHFSENPALLRSLIREGKTDIEKYAVKPGEHFRPKRKTEWWPHYLNKPESFAKWLVAKLGEKGPGHEIMVEEAPKLSFRPLDYEVNPLRTTKAIYEDGVSGRKSGQGGIDLLLSLKDGTPVIGEIKASTDVDLFTALVQALIYAVELSSNRQRERLSSAYSNSMPRLSNDTGLKIFLIYEETPDPNDKRLKRFTSKVARSILDDDACKSIITDIVFISCAVHNGAPIFTFAPI